MNAYRLKPLRFPWPPLFYGAAIATALLLGHIASLPMPSPGGALLMTTGALLIVVAIALDLWALKTLWSHHTTVLPHRSATRLVTDGPFRYTRNPIYLGYTILTVAIGLMTGNPWFFLAALVAAVVTTSIAIRCEEAHLLARFGADYERYCKRTRRWI